MNIFLQALKKAGWAPIAVFVGHLVGCETGAYETYPPLDAPMHFLGGLAIAFFLWTCFFVASRTGALGNPNRNALALLTFTSAVACAMFWEFAEFLSDRYLGTTTQTGMEDTLLDMLLGVIGAAVFVGAALLRQGRRDETADEEGSS